MTTTVVMYIDHGINIMRLPFMVELLFTTLPIELIITLLDFPIPTIATIGTHPPIIMDAM